jgi:hypothetical protein
MGRFSDIRRGGELKQALDSYVQYLQNPPARQINSRGDRDPSITAYVTPFGFDIEADEVVEVSANEQGFNRLQAIVNGAGTGAQVSNALGSASVTQVGRFRPARVTTFENGTKTKTVERSRYTNQQYLKYAGDRFSCPFGRNTATDDIDDAYQQIRAALKARAGLAVNRVSLSPERLYAS